MGGLGVQRVWRGRDPESRGGKNSAAQGRGRGGTADSAYGPIADGRRGSLFNSAPLQRVVFTAVRLDCEFD